jgi:hypothetical protein
MRTVKVKLELTVRCDDDEDSLRESIKQDLQEKLDDDMLDYSVVEEEDTGEEDF